MLDLSKTKITCAGNKIDFADLGSGKFAEDKLKSAFVDLLRDQIKLLDLTQTEAAAFMGIKQPDVSRLVSGRADRFTLARVLAFVRALGGDVEIKVRAKSAISEGRMSLDMAREAA